MSHRLLFLSLFSLTSLCIRLSLSVLSLFSLFHSVSQYLSSISVFLNALFRFLYAIFMLSVTLFCVCPSSFSLGGQRLFSYMFSHLNIQKKTHQNNIIKHTYIPIHTYVYLFVNRYMFIYLIISFPFFNQINA